MSSHSMAERETEMMTILDPKGLLIWTCNWISVFASALYPFVDPLFFYIPGIDSHNKCLDFNHTLIIVACFLRSVPDFLSIIRSIRIFGTFLKRIIQRRTIRFSLRKVWNAGSVLFFFLLDVFAVLPLPQFIFLGGAFENFGTPDKLLFPILLLYIVRLQRWQTRSIFIALAEGKDVDLDSAAAAPWWPTAANSFYYCTLASHVAGASWYLLSMSSELRCWGKELNMHRSAFVEEVACGKINQTMVSRLNNSCSFINPNETFDYGIFISALTSHVAKSSTGFLTKLFYCFWWGLRNLSSFGQNLQTSTNIGEIIFSTSISIFSLVLFTLLLRNIQNYDRSISKKREKKQIRDNAEVWLSGQNVPECLRKRIRQHEDYKWQSTRFFDEETLICNLPKYIRRDLKRHLCSNLLTKVPQFKTMDSYLLDLLYDRLKPVLYITETYIFHGGKPIEEMIFIQKGNLKSTAKVGGRPGSFKYSNLKDGDFCGEELVTWALDPNFSSDFLPISTRTVKTISKVKAYALMADDLKYIGSQLRSMQLYQLSRLHDEELRTLAACKIQKAWFRYKKWKMEQSLLAAEASPESASDMAVGRSCPGLTNYASRSAADGVPSIWEKGESSNISAT